MSHARHYSPEPASVLAELTALLARELRMEPQDLDTGRPFLELGADSVVFVEVVHWIEQRFGLRIAPHQLFDELVDLDALAEFIALYSAAGEPERASLPRLPLQYTDYALAQRQGSDAEALARQLEYWTARLEGAPTALALPTDHPRHLAGGFRSVTHARRLESSQLEALREAARGAQVTLHMALLSTFALLLHRHTGQDELLIGAPVMTRDRAELRDLIGLFVNTLVFRIGIDEHQSFTELLHQVRRTTLDAYANQDIPFRDVVKAVAPERSPDRHPLFQTWFNLDIDREATALQLGERVVEPLEEQIDTPTQLDLSLYVQQQGDRLVLEWIYNERLFERSTIENLAEQFEWLLAQLVAEPERELGRASLLTPRAAALLPDAAAELPAPAYPSVCDMIARRAAHAPEFVAVSQGARSWSYRQLQDAATEIAESLEFFGEPRDVVAVTGAPSFGLIASVLAVLGSERVLLTIDPGLPRERKRVMLREAGARYVIHVGPQDEELDGPEVEAVHVDPATARWGRVVAVDCTAGPATEPSVSEADGGPAYVFFTSGTTGTPKGVLGTHAGIAHFVDWQRRQFSVRPGDRVAQTTSSGFDAILRDIFLPLTSGATLCLPEPDDLLKPAATLRWLERARISVLHVVPTLGEVWSSAAAPELRLPELRLLFFAGEPLGAELVQAWRALAPGVQIVNLYGPTETTMIKSYGCVPDEPRPGIQPVGEPLPHGQSLVWGDEQRPCGIGELGEIVLRTPYRTRGYINAPSEQARRFIVNPFGRRPDDILYRTGDLGRYRADGQLEVLGRLDRQIKLRGVRVELGELESVLASHPRVTQASV